MNDKQSGWHLDKRVPIALIFALIVQGAGLIWWGTNLDNRVMSLEKLADDMNGARDSVAAIRERTVALETRLEAIQSTLARIERLIESKYEARP